MKDEPLTLDLATLREVADFLKISESTVRRLRKARKLKARLIGRQWRFESRGVLRGMRA